MIVLNRGGLNQYLMGGDKGLSVLAKKNVAPPLKIEQKAASFNFLFVQKCMFQNYKTIHYQNT